jgi:hypothetical protein
MENINFAVSKVESKKIETQITLYFAKNNKHINMKVCIDYSYKSSK